MQKQRKAEDGRLEADGKEVNIPAGRRGGQLRRVNSIFILYCGSIATSYQTFRVLYKTSCKLGSC